MKKADSAAYAVAPKLGPEGRQALLAAFDKVGVYVREEPFPPAEIVHCAKGNCRIFTTENEPVANQDGCFDFEVLCPVNGAAETGSGNGTGGGGGLYSGSGQCYALVRRLKKAIYGSVQLAQVVRLKSNDANGVAFEWTTKRVAIKCISKATLAQKKKEYQSRGVPASEDPRKEVNCLAYLTRRMNGTLAGPEKVRGNPQRVVPVIDLLEDYKTIYLVRFD